MLEVGRIYSWKPGTEISIIKPFISLSWFHESDYLIVRIVHICCRGISIFIHPFADWTRSDSSFFDTVKLLFAVVRAPPGNCRGHLQWCSRLLNRDIAVKIMTISWFSCSRSWMEISSRPIMLSSIEVFLFPHDRQADYWNNRTPESMPYLPN
jgi:hypothetical protein